MVRNCNAPAITTKRSTRVTQTLTTYYRFMGRKCNALAATAYHSSNVNLLQSFEEVESPTRPCRNSVARYIANKKLR